MFNKKTHIHTWDNDEAYREAWRKMFIHKEMEPVITQKCKKCPHVRQIKIIATFHSVEVKGA